ncbi:MAG TPA: hypothetical protein DCE02_06180 [Ruminiclostridium sp.]|nr:hypothetical protein [Ruminiclostridium sp.]
MYKRQLLYPALNVIYVLFLPKEIKKAFVYTVFWMATMIIFEYVSLLTKTIVFTGWKPMPWSLITYIGTYLWVYTLYKFMERKKYFQESY